MGVCGLAGVGFINKIKNDRSGYYANKEVYGVVWQSIFHSSVATVHPDNPIDLEAQDDTMLEAYLPVYGYAETFSSVINGTI